MENIVEIMEKRLYDICQEIDVNASTLACLQRNGIDCILDVLKREVMKKTYRPAMTQKMQKEMALIFQYYGIRYNDLEQYKELIKQYNMTKNNENIKEKQIENNEPAIGKNKAEVDTEQKTSNSLELIKIMETPIEKLGLTGHVLNPLKKNIEYDVQCRVIDVLQFIAEHFSQDYSEYSPLCYLTGFGKKSNDELKKVLLPFGINIDNVKNCKQMNEQYKQIKGLKNENSALENQTEIIKSMNNELKEEIKRELEKNKLLKEKLAQQEQEFYALINIRNSIKETVNNDLESSNTHGTK